MKNIYKCFYPYNVFSQNGFIQFDCGHCTNCKKKYDLLYKKHYLKKSKPKIIRNLIYFFNKLIPKKLKINSYCNLLKKRFNNN